MSIKQLTLKELEQDLLTELNDNIDDIRENEYVWDYIIEMIDSEIPVYTSDLLDIAKNKLWLAEEEPEILCYGKNTAIASISGNIYEHLQKIARNWLDNNKIDY